MSVSLTTRQAIAAMIRKEPSLPAAEIGKRLGVSRERVRQLLDALNYEWHPGQWKRKAKPAARRPVGRPRKPSDD